MEVKTQFDDYVGSAAADGCDHKNLRVFLDERGVDTSQYHPIGAKFHSTYNNAFKGSIICVDKHKSAGEKHHIVSISFEEDLTRDEFFSLFKKLHVVVAQKFYHDHEIAEEITFDDRQPNNE